MTLECWAAKRRVKGCNMNPLELRQLIKHKQNEAYEAAALVAKSYNGETAALELADEIRDLKHKDA